MEKSKELVSYLSEFVTEKRLSLFNDVIAYRTRYITVVLEDIYQSQNASAVLRTCDCFGIQNVHVIENRNTFNINPDVALGASKWLDINYFNQSNNNSVDAIKHLKKKGYRIVATSPHLNDVTLNDFNFEKGPFALFFGTELNGISKDVMDGADEYLKIPMLGFTESFNISVSAAIILHFLSKKVRESGVNWVLSENEKNEVLINWLSSSIRGSEHLIKNFFSNFDK